VGGWLVLTSSLLRCVLAYRSDDWVIDSLCSAESIQLERIQKGVIGPLVECLSH